MHEKQWRSEGWAWLGTCLAKAPCSFLLMSHDLANVQGRVTQGYHPRVGGICSVAEMLAAQIVWWSGVGSLMMTMLECTMMAIWDFIMIRYKRRRWGQAFTYFICAYYTSLY